MLLYDTNFSIKDILFWIAFLVPDELVTKALIQRLSRLDAVKRGWVLHGFPKTRTQLDSLTEQGLITFRLLEWKDLLLFFFTMPKDSSQIHNHESDLILSFIFYYFIGYEPNRVVVLDIPSDTAVERLSLRSVDPQTGYRFVIMFYK